MLLLIEIHWKPFACTISTLEENARRDNGTNLSCPDSGGRSEPQVNLIYSKELCSALSGPSAAALSPTIKPVGTTKQPWSVMLKKHFLICYINWSENEKKKTWSSVGMKFKKHYMWILTYFTYSCIWFIPVIFLWLYVESLFVNKQVGGHFKSSSVFSVKMPSGSWGIKPNGEHSC